MDYEGRLELKLAGDFELDAERIGAALEATGIPHVLAGNPETRGVLIIVPLDASDGLDALQQVMELWNTVWSEAFPGLAPSEIASMTAKPGRPDLGDGEEHEVERIASSEDEEWSEIDAELAAEAAESA